MGAQNKVIAGEYTGKYVISTVSYIGIILGFTKKIIIDKDTVEDYEVINEDITKSAISAVGRGLIGNFLVGPVGLLAGLSAKNKGAYTIAIQFKDGTRSLIEVDDKIYKGIIKELF
ncbi:hypothetical protein LOZ80_13750 [Paenibacillus sp. HWE-109]|uniref:hypothetical protein n=1 Tax=Paenibacillus sp. HWE-109 TaxID=1306526 RepID=UPI001EE13300|nr:hypothetical protein [Paenibacillus sp. HWE-109]UKS29935.1 hypothetical protein LOZ80_13750 [Paenibacillus sp. HWE-109]